jgi:PPK2 family polyphosphate:nucleotide phosphotransferase
MKQLDLPEKLRVAPGARVALAEKDAARTFGWYEAQARATSLQLAAELGELQYQMYADGRFGLLVVLQGIDGAGKDGTVRHVFSAFNPQGCTVRSFKAPSPEELRHDYLWRVHPHVPARGEVVVFNRSHYEDVLVPRVDGLVAPGAWKARYAQINDFERMLVENGIHVLKLFLHISRAEQKQRFEVRIHERQKQWKFDPQDLVKRGEWGAYRLAYQDMLGRCSTRAAPWYVVPADHKWLRDLAVGQVVLAKLRSLPLRFPAPNFDPRRLKVK